MNSRTYKSEGIVLARKNYSEADKIIVVYTKNFGKISFIAKGIRRPKSRKRASLEIFTRIRFFAAKGKNLDIITETEIIDLYPEIRENLKKVAVAYSLMETIGKTTREGEKHEIVYDTLVQYLEELKKSNSLRDLRSNFIYDILVFLGFWPIGKKMDDPDKILEDVVEGRMSSVRVGKKMLS